MNSKTKKIFYGLSIAMFLLSGIAIAFLWKSHSKAQTFKLFFNPNGGTGEMAAQNVDSGKNYPLTRGSFVAPEGKEFVGWCIDPVGTNKIYKAGEFYQMPYTSMTLYAIWGNTVTFDSRGGTEVESQIVLDGKTATVPSSPVKDNMVFAGWYTDLENFTDLNDFNTKKFDFTNTPITQNTTLYAVYFRSVRVRVFDATTGNTSMDRGAKYTCSVKSGEFTTGTNFNLYSEKMSYPVSLTVTPSEGYHFVAWRNGSATDKDKDICYDTTLELSSISDPAVGNMWYMDCYPVVSSDPLISDIFSDVKAGGWEEKAVMYVYQKNIMSGKGDKKFAPNSTIKREEFVQALFNHDGKKTVAIDNPYTDVPNKAGYPRDAILWAKANGIANGSGNNKFGVGKEITRQDLIVMLYKYTKYKGYEMYSFEGASDGFTDSDQIAPYAKQAMDWAVHRGIMKGKGTGDDKSQLRLDPKGNATRVECASIFSKILY